MEEKDNKKYEITFWLKEENASPVREVLQKNGAEILTEKEMQKMQLSYMIQKESYAFLSTIEFSINPEAIQKVKDALNLNHAALRYVVTAVDERKAAQQAELSMLRERSTYPPSFKKKEESILTNESLEKKIEEILN